MDLNFDKTMSLGLVEDITKGKVFVVNRKCAKNSSSIQVSFIAFSPMCQSCDYTETVALAAGVKVKVNELSAPYISTDDAKKLLFTAWYNIWQRFSPECAEPNISDFRVLSV